MTRQRYDEIRKMSGPAGALRYAFPKPRYQNDTVGETVYAGGITEDEHKAVMAKWETLPGYYSYSGALQALVED